MELILVRQTSTFVRAKLAGSVLAAAMCAVSVPAAAQSAPVLLRDSFPIGDGNGILCQVQDRSVESPAKLSMFDRAWAVVCRDSAQPVSEVFAFKRPIADDPYEVIARQRRSLINCTANVKRSSALDGLTIRECSIEGTELGWSIFSVERGDMTFLADGFTAYDDATLLALKSVVNNAIARGSIDAASTSVADPLSFARVQAETLKPEQALAEGYRRNLGGEYAEAAAYFETLQRRLESDPDTGINPGEFIINRALQKSNLGEFGSANRLFAEAEPLTVGDPIAGRLQRNFEAVHLLNQGFYPEAIERLSRPLENDTLGVSDQPGGLAITLPMAERINQAGQGTSLLGFVDEMKLTPQERAKIIDAQALQLRGTARRIDGQLDAARNDLITSYSRAIAVRDGRVTSIARLRAQTLTELAIIAERRGKQADAEAYLRNGLSILEEQLPDRRAVSGLQARLAAFLLRRERDDEAMALYRGVIDNAVGKRDAISGFANQLNPYYRVLAPQVGTDASAAADFFKAAQVLIRPGVAETQATLARELSANSDDAARLFRQSIDLGRDIERLRIRFEALAKVRQTEQVQAQRAELSAQIDQLQQSQLQTQAQLSEYPQYRAVAARSLELSDFKQSLNAGEAYARILVVGDDLFMFYTDGAGSQAYPLDISKEDLDFQVDIIRASISLLEAGQYVTYPFEVGEAHKLYQDIFAPIAGRLAGIDHLIFEPDGALLRLPLEVLVSDQTSVDRYQARMNNPAADAFDFTGVNWFGKGRKISTAVSAQAFVDARKVDPSNGAKQYLGMGRNKPIGDSPPPTVQAVLASGSNECGWNAGLWNRPIDDAELFTAQGLIGESRSDLIVGEAFSDAAVKGKDDLDEYRIVHFATHGLVTPPNPSCAANPALVTSFGGGTSDGLLSFEEIFELNLDADIIILSACDTAGEASIEATRAAGVSTGGGTALDGLVRSFIGAGGRSVLASHWPAPDDFDATERLMSEMFRLGATATIGDALRGSQQKLMDDPETSHPYYWAGFSLIGDAKRALLSGNTLAHDSGVSAGDGASPETVVGQ